MIVNLQADGWEIIYHRAHALLAAQIGGNWNHDKTPVRLYETLAAISHHDDLEKEWEETLLTPAGAPLDFTLESDPDIDQMRRHAENALYRGRWVALLTSMHLSFLNEGRVEEYPELAEFVAQQRQNQAQWLEALEVSREEAEAAYRFMRWCDRLSLILCQQQIPDAGRHLEVQVGPQGDRYSVFQRDNGRLGLVPWPFSNAEVTVNVEAIRVQQLKFDSDEALVDALKTAPRKILTWTFEQTEETAESQAQAAAVVG
jgi:Protein of unknown function (DUF3891)